MYGSEQGGRECRTCLCGSSVSGVGGALVLSVCVVSLDSLCRWQVQVSVYCARQIPAYLRYKQCLTLLHLIDICFVQLTHICLWQILQI